MFDCENAIALPAMQGIRDSSRCEGEVSWVFSSCRRNLENILELWRGCPFETGVFSAKSGHLSRYDGQLKDCKLGLEGQYRCFFKSRVRAGPIF